MKKRTFLLVNHGIDGDLIPSVVKEATGCLDCRQRARHLYQEPQRECTVSKRSGCGNEEKVMETSEEFVWRTDEGLKAVMEGIWSEGYSNFCQKMENLNRNKVTCKLLQALIEHACNANQAGYTAEGQEMVELVCCLYKHCQYAPISEWDRSLKSDIIRMLIRGSDLSHALCVHICHGATYVHIYSKKSWISSSQDRDALVVTIGGQIQWWASQECNGQASIQSERRRIYIDGFPLFSMRYYA